ncbi:MAG TPA: hypothetical protein VGE65_03385 [Sphingobium sp.]
MTGIRTWLRRNRALAALILGIMLSVRLLMPSGYMLSSENKVLTVVICTGISGEHQTAQLVIPQDNEKAGHDAGKTDPCPYSALSMVSTAAADAALLAGAIAFILALGFAPFVAPLRALIPHLRPPLRGPPVAI